MQLPPVLCPAVPRATTTTTTSTTVAESTPRISHRSRTVSRRRAPSVASAGPPAGIGFLLTRCGLSAVLALAVRVLAVRVGTLLLEFTLEHLARGIAGQLVQEHDLARNLIAGQVLLDVALDVVLGQTRALAQDHERLQALSELLVLDSGDGGLGDPLVAGQQLLD